MSYTPLSVDYKDVALAQEAGILRGFDPTSKKYDCAVCPKIGYGDIIPHLCNLQHRNAAAWEAIHCEMPNTAMLSFVSEVIREAKIQSEIEAVDKKVFSYKCKICVGKRPFNGLAPLEQHLHGGDHNKNKARLGLTRKNPLPNNGTSSSPVENANQTPQRPIDNRGLHQSTYQRLSNVQSQDFPHLSKLSLSSQTQGGAVPKYQIWNTKYPSPNMSSESIEPPSANLPPYSDSIQRSPLSHYSYQEFLPPKAKDALSSGTVVEKEKTESWTSYFCKVCNVPLTGAKPLMQHVDSSKHQKRVNGHQMFSLPTSGPSNDSSRLVHDFVTQSSLSPSAVEAVNSGVVEEKGGAFFCKVCNVPLTGPMPLNQHADSEKHRKKVSLNSTIRRNPPSRPPEVTLGRLQKEGTVSDSKIINNLDPQSRRNQSTGEEVNNDETETDGLVQDEISDFQNKQENWEPKTSVSGISFTKQDPMAIAISALEKIDFLEEKDSSDFCQFITSELKKLDPDLCKKAKRKIQLVLFEAQDMQDQRDGDLNQYLYKSYPRLPLPNISSSPLPVSNLANSLLSPIDFIQDANSLCTKDDTSSIVGLFCNDISKSLCTKDDTSPSVGLFCNDISNSLCTKDDTSPSVGLFCNDI